MFTSTLEEIQEELRQASLANRAKSAGAPPAPERVKALLEQGKAIYGNDSRVEAAGAAGIPVALVRGVCMLMKTGLLQPVSGGFALKPETFGVKYGLCPGQRFHDQPVLGYGSGFLVAPDVIATAGHCVPDELGSICVLFDFEVRNGVTPLTRASHEVYYVVEVIKSVKEAVGADYALLRLDRPVTDVAPLPLRDQDVVRGDPVYVVGHPVGLPKKAAQGAHVSDDTPAKHFVANLDTFGGNSGSPVFAADNRVCGILVRGAPDFVVQGNCVVATTFPLDQAGESVCRVSVWCDAVPRDKLAGNFDVNGATRPPGDGHVVAPRMGPHRVTGAFRKELSSFLSSAFNTEDLKQFAYYDDRFAPLIGTVNWREPLNNVVTSFIEGLVKEGLLDDEFFELLRDARPRRRADIDEIQRLL